MLSLRRVITLSCNRFGSALPLSSSRSAQTSVQNEKQYEYLPESSERQQLEAKLQEFEATVYDVPIVVGDEEIRTGDVKYQVSPFDHQKKIAKYHYADAKTIQKAIDASQVAFKSWGNKSLNERIDVFMKAADLISGKYRMDVMAATMLGQAKTIVQAEIDSTVELIDFLRFNCAFATDLTKYKPIDTPGVTNTMAYRPIEGFWAAVSPFNFTAIGGNLSSAPAIMGNVVLWKPSNTAVLSNYLVYKIYREAGLPPGVINFLPSEGPVFGNTVVQSPHLAGINFTGSVPTFQYLWKKVGDNISSYKSFPRLIGECGGKNYHLIHPTAEVKHTVNCALRAAFEYGGQKCSACSRMYVPESKWGEIKEGLLAEIGKIKLGSPLEGDTFLSAVIDQKSFSNIKGYLEHAKSSPDLKVIAGGECDNSKGYYIQPTIVESKTTDDKILTEEIFGPVLAVYVYPDAKFDDMFEIIDKSTPFGLTGAVFSKDLDAANRAYEALKHSAGNFYINDKCTGSVVGQQPFGGARLSGTDDKAGGPHYMLKFVAPQAIKTSTEPLTDWRYPYMG